MGQAVTKSDTAPCDFATWPLERAKKISAQYKEDNYDFGLNEDHFRALLAESLKDTDLDHGGVARELWYYYSKPAIKDLSIEDPQVCIMISEVCTGLVALCQGKLDERLTFIFELCDWNGQNFLNYDDSVMLLFSALSGVARMAQRPLPTEYEIEMLARCMFDAYNLDGPHVTIRKDQSVQWAMRQLEELSSASGGPPKLPAVVSHFLSLGKKAAKKKASSVKPEG